MAKKENALGRFLKLFAVVAVAIAAVFCLLVGCGSNRREAENINEPKTEVGNKTDADDEREEHGGSGAPSMYPTHFVASSFQSEYDLDNVEIPIAYAFRDGYPLYRNSEGYKVSDYEIYLLAYKEEYDEKYNTQFYYLRNTQENFERLDALQPGEIDKRFFVVEKISFPKNENGLIDLEAVKSTLASDFGYSYDATNDYWVFDHYINAKLPRELFDDGSTIHFDIKFLIKCEEVPNLEEDSPYIEYQNYSWISGYTKNTPCFNYTVYGDRIELTDIGNGYFNLKPYEQE